MTLTRAESRRFPRVPVRTKAVIMHDLGAAARGETRDLSLGGVFVETTDSIAFGTKIVVHLLERSLALPGTVRWQTPEGVGIQFGSLGARETFALTELVSAND